MDALNLPSPASQRPLPQSEVVVPCCPTWPCSFLAGGCEVIWKGCTAVLALQLLGEFWDRGVSRKSEKLFCQGERNETHHPRLAQCAFPYPGRKAVWWRQMFLHNSDEVSMPRTRMRRNTCFMQPEYSYSLEDNFKPISTFHSLTSRLSSTMAIHPGMTWTRVVENSVWLRHLFHCTLLYCLWDAVKSSFSVKATFSVPEQYAGLHWAQSQLEPYLDVLSRQNCFNAHAISWRLFPFWIARPE